MRRTGYFLNHLNVASGSQAELQTQLELAARLHLADQGRVEKLLTDSSEVGRMIHALAASVERDRALHD